MQLPIRSSFCKLKGIYLFPQFKKENILKCFFYFSPEFTSTFLSNNGVLNSNQFSKEYSGQLMLKFFEDGEEIPDKDQERDKNQNLDDITSLYVHNFRNCIYNVFINKRKIKIFTFLALLGWGYTTLCLLWCHLVYLLMIQLLLSLIQKIKYIKIILNFVRNEIKWPCNRYMSINNKLISSLWAPWKVFLHCFTNCVLYMEIKQQIYSCSLQQGPWNALASIFNPYGSSNNIRGTQACWRHPKPF